MNNSKNKNLCSIGQKKTNKIVDIKKHVNEKYPLLKIKAIKTDSIDLFSSSILTFDNTLSKLPDSFNEISRISYKSNHSNDSF